MHGGIIVLKKRRTSGYLLAEIVIEMVLFCGLISLFFNEQRVLIEHERQQIGELKKIDKNLNISKKMMIVGYDELSMTERQKIDKYKIYR